MTTTSSPLRPHREKRARAGILHISPSSPKRRGILSICWPWSPRCYWHIWSQALSPKYNMYCQVLTVPKDRDHNLSGQLVLVLDHAHPKNVLAYVYRQLLVFRFSPTASCYPHFHPIWYLYTLTRSSQSLLFLGVNPSFLSLPSYDGTRQHTRHVSPLWSRRKESPPRPTGTDPLSMP